MNLVVFVFFLFASPQTFLRNLSFLGFFLSALALIGFVFNATTKFIRANKPEMAMVLISIVWMITGFFLAGICVLCFSIIGFYTKTTIEILFKEEGLIYPSFPKRLIPWNEISNVVLKDKILTLDFKNNKLLQAEITRDCAIDIDELVFNNFCNKKLRLVG